MGLYEAAEAGAHFTVPDGAIEPCRFRRAPLGL